MSQCERYLAEQALDSRAVFVARAGNTFAGYVTLLWTPAYEPFRTEGLPEIQDLNVLPHVRRLGIAKQLLEAAEALATTRSDAAGIGVGLHSDYGPAQRLYSKLGYVPDRLGIAYDAQTVGAGYPWTIASRST